MKSNSKILLTKDALYCGYLPCYGNRYWAGKTPNLDELVEKGTLYTRYYTAAPSSSMSYLTMFTSQFPYQLSNATYDPRSKEYAGETLFQKANKLGFTCHVMWDEFWTSCINFERCYGAVSQFHPLHGLHQGVGAHYPHEGYLEPDDEKLSSMFSLVEQKLEEISQLDQKVFLWFHVPHVVYGRVAYGSDMDAFDHILGIVRHYYSDENIVISADHGNMNGFRGVLGYGFDVNEPAIRIPLITPRKEGLSVCDDLMCNIDIYQILFEDSIPRREVVYSDSAYYGQDNRNLAIIKGNYKYIYHKKTKREELYDLAWDASEQFNLMTDLFDDPDRKVIYPARELYFYSEWEALPAIRGEFRALRQAMWRDKPTWWKIAKKCKGFLRKILKALRLK